MKNQSLRILSLITLTAALGACSGGSSGGNTGELRLGLTDGPVEHADRVVVAFTGIQLKAANDGAPMAAEPFDASACDEFDTATNTCFIDLLTLTGSNRKVVFNSDLPAGTYEWMRLAVDADRNEMDSYVDVDGMICPLYIPSGAQSGLKVIKDITVTANGVSDYTLDFDVRKSITAPPGLGADAGTMEMCTQNYVMKPVIRIVDTTETGTITGSVSTDTLAVNECPMDMTSGEYINVAAYVFENFDGNAVADDIDGVDELEATAGSSARDPVTTATVSYDVDADAYNYEAGYLLEGDYLVAVTCEADADLPDSNELDLDPASDAAPTFGFVAETPVTLDGVAVSVPPL